MNDQITATAAVHSVEPIKSNLEATPGDCGALQEIARGVITALEYPRGSEAQIRCLEEVGQNATRILKSQP